MKEEPDLRQTETATASGQESITAKLAQLKWPTTFPADHGSTPGWVIDILLPVIRATGNRVIDPFYYDGTAGRHFAERNIRCIHSNAEYGTIDPLNYDDSLLVTCPPQSLLRSLFKNYLRKTPFWAILIPTSKLRKKWTQDPTYTHVHITLPFELDDSPSQAGPTRMTWVLKGIPTPARALYTRRGITYAQGAARTWDRHTLRQEILRQLGAHEHTATSLHTMRLTRSACAHNIQREPPPTEREATIPSKSDTQPAVPLAEPRSAQEEEQRQIIMIEHSHVTEASFASMLLMIHNPLVKLGLKGKAIRAIPKAATNFPVRISETLSALTKILTEGGITLRAPCLQAMCQLYKSLSMTRTQKLRYIETVIPPAIANFMNPGTHVKRITKMIRQLVNTLQVDQPEATAVSLVSALDTDSDRIQDLAPAARDVVKQWISRITRANPDAPARTLQVILGLLDAKLPDNAIGRWSTNTAVWDLYPNKRISPSPTTDPDDLPPAKVRSIWQWNVNGLRRMWRNGDLQRFILRRRPDVLVLTETKCDEFRTNEMKQFRQHLLAWGYTHCYWTWSDNHKKGSYGYSGTCVITKVPGTSHMFGLNDPAIDEEGRAITLRWDNFTLVATYVPCTEMDTPFITAARSNWHEKVHRHLQLEKKTNPLIWCGDLNTAIQAEDAYIRGKHAPNNPGTKVLEREALQLIMKEVDLVDTYRWFNPRPSAKDYTWHPQSTQSHARGQRLDYFMSSAQLHGDSTPFRACYVDNRQHGSDHLPVALLLNLPATATGTMMPPPQQPEDQSMDVQGAPDPDPVGDINDLLTQLELGEDPDTDTKTGAIPACLLFESGNRWHDIAIQQGENNRVTAKIPYTAIDADTPWPEIKDTEFFRDLIAELQEEDLIADLDDLDIIRTDPFGEIHDEAIGRSDEYSEAEDEPETQRETCARYTQNSANTSPSCMVVDEGSDSDDEEEIIVDTHSRQNLNTLMPDVHLRYGKNRVPGHTLIDSGALHALMTKAYARKIGARRVHTTHRPTFTMADRSRKKPIGMVKVKTWFTADRTAATNIYYWVFENMPVDVIIGSEVLDALKGIIDYKNRNLHITVRGVETVVPLGMTQPAHPLAATVLYAQEQTLVRPGEHVQIRVHPGRRSPTTGQFGVIHNHPTNMQRGLLTARGVTYCRPNSDRLIMMNFSDNPVVIRRGMQVALFHREDENAYVQARTNLGAEEEGKEDISPYQRLPTRPVAIPRPARRPSAPPEKPIAIPRPAYRPSAARVAATVVPQPEQENRLEPLPTTATSRYTQQQVAQQESTANTPQPTQEAQSLRVMESPSTRSHHCTLLQEAPPAHMLDPAQRQIDSSSQAEALEDQRQPNWPANPSSVDLPSPQEISEAEWSKHTVEARSPHCTSPPRHSIRGENDHTDIPLPRDRELYQTHRRIQSSSVEHYIPQSQEGVMTQLGTTRRTTVQSADDALTRPTDAIGKSRPDEIHIPDITKNPRKRLPRLAKDAHLVDQAVLDNAFTTDPLKDMTINPQGTYEDTNVTRLKRLMYRYKNLWEGADDMPSSKADHGFYCRLELTKEPNWRARSKRYTPVQRQVIEDMIQAQLKAGIIEPSTSPWTSNILLVPKPGGKLRFCLSFVELNKCTKVDAYLLPRIDDILSNFHGNSCFSICDLTSAFYNVKMDPQSKQYTAFASPFGVFQYTRLPMGVRNGPSVFQRLIDKVLTGLKYHCCLAYIDDIAIFSANIEDHLAATSAIFSRLEEYDLTLKASKCEFLTDKIKFLGHQVTPDGVSPDPGKLKAIQDIPMPTDKDTLRSFLGVASYYRSFINGFSRIAKPLLMCLKKEYRLPRKKGKVDWTDKQIEVFERLKKLLTSAPILGHPDWTAPFTLTTDACTHGLGGVLSQTSGGEERVIAYASRSLTSAETRYSIHELEYLAILWATELYKCYLSPVFGQQFKIVTDSMAVKHILENANENTRCMRWTLRMSSYNYKIEHHPGRTNKVADGLSRCPLLSTCPYGQDAIETPYSPEVIVAAAGVAHKTTDGNDTIPLSRHFPHPDKHTPRIVATATPSNSPPTENTKATDGKLPVVPDAFFPPVDKTAWNMDEFRKLQRKDTACKAILTKQASKDDQSPHFHVDKDGTLWKVHHANKHNTWTKDKHALVVPQSLKAFILRSHHGLPLVGHPGVSKVKKAMAYKYWWSGMATDTKRWVNSCLACALRKTPRPTRAGKAYTMESPEPWHTVAIDLCLGRQRGTKEANTYLLTMVDTFSRWPIAVPIPDKEPATIAAAIYRHLLTVHGSPRRILTDKGSEFVNHGLDAMCAHWEIARITTAARDSKANGHVERWHRSLNSSMTMLMARFGPEWDTYVDACLWGYRISVNETTGLSPFEILYGRPPITPLDHTLSLTPPHTHETETAYNIWVSKRMHAMYDVIRRRQHTMAARNQARRAKSCEEVEYEVGDTVLYYQPDQQPHANTNKASKFSAPAKWTSMWTGPHRITAKCGKNSYHIRDGRTGLIREKCSVRSLWPYCPWSDAVPSTSPDIDKAYPWVVGGRVKKGSLFAVAADPAKGTFWIGRTLSDDVGGHLYFQWYSNPANNKNGTSNDPFWPGWTNPAKSTEIWKRDQTKAHKTPLTSADTKTTITSWDCIAHGFELTTTGKIPAPLRRHIQDYLTQTADRHIDDSD